jgi:hypothetical protein
MNKTRHKRQKYKYHSRKAFNHKKHAKIRKSAKNKQPTNLLFKTVKLYKKQKNKYLDKENSIPIRVKKQKGGFQVEEDDIKVFKNAKLTQDNILTIMDILEENDANKAAAEIETLNDPFNEQLKEIIQKYNNSQKRDFPEGDNKLDFLKVLAQKLGLNVEKIHDDDIEKTIATKIQEIRNDPQFKKKMADALQETIKKADAAGNQPHKQQPQQSGEDDDTAHAAAVAAQHDLDHQSAEKMVAKEHAEDKQPVVTAKVVHDEGGGGGGNDDDTTREKPKKEKDEKDERTASFEQQDKARRKFASEKQVLNRLQRDLKQHNVSTKIFKDPTKLETLFTYEINTFDDLVNKNNSTIRNIMEKMKLNSTEKEKLLNLIKEYKYKKSNKTNNVNDNVNNKKPRQKTGNVSKLLKEIDDYKTKLENIQLKMKEMKSKKGDHVCFDTTTPDIVKEAGKDKVEKGTTVRICIESKKNVKEWAKSVAKGKNDKVITGNTLDISAESV